MQGPILVTGAAGFLGYHLCAALLDQGIPIIGVDCFSPYYAIAFKQARIKRLESPYFGLETLDLRDSPAVQELFERYKFTQVIHLAAQPGVRYSREHPQETISHNLMGLVPILEGCRLGQIPLILASSSSVYGATPSLPFQETECVDQPRSVYAATKRSGELLAQSYSHLYDLPITVLRFFTVYGPWGRPDMAYFTFTQKILAGKKIELFNQGRNQRDFTYSADVITVILHLLTSNWPGYQILNVGRGKPLEIRDLVHHLEYLTGCQAQVALRAADPTEPPITWADTTRLKAAIGYVPTTDLAQGLAEFWAWYQEYGDLAAD